jgi:hypothetical protein
MSNKLSSTIFIINLPLLSLSLTVQLKSVIIILFVLLFPVILLGQKARVEGRVTDSTNKPIELVNVAVLGEKKGTTTDYQGRYELDVPAGKEITLAYSFIGFADKRIQLTMQENETREVDVNLKTITTTLPGFTVTDERLRTESMVRLNPRDALAAPALNQSISDILVTLPGVTTSNELSSQYSVRGGNFDENNVFVNDIEIYRPFLISQGQQEGLSFVNPAMTSSLLFSAGGFGAEYGDRMSSVLDVKYKNPSEFEGSFSISLLGADLMLGGTAAKKKFRYLAGARYQTNRYVLNSLQTEGEYTPDFIDVQTLLGYEFNKKWDLSFLGYYSRNRYIVEPTSRETDFGTISEVLRLKVFFDGNETDRYEVLQGGLTLKFKPKKNMELKLITSAFRTNEMETYDIRGQYWIGLVENNPGSNEFGDVIQNRGVGTYLEHARNYFNAAVFTVEHKGSSVTDNRFVKWGIRYQHQQVNDILKEWEMIDSAGYSLPHPWNVPGSGTPYNPPFDLSYSVTAENTLTVNRLAAYGSSQWNFTMKNNDLITFTAGLRINTWDYNDQLLFSPRFNFSYKPYKKQNVVFRFSAGLYYQPPFYREMRNMDGSLFPDSQAQQSLQFILGNDYRFQAWNRPFIFTTEVYYKYLDNLIPYVVDNVRVRYYADQTARGYAAGVDFKVFGEFVKGIDSWLSLSIMKTEEDIYGDYYYEYYNEDGEQIIRGITANDQVADSLRIEPGFIPRPSDRRVNFSIFFQDYIPKLPYLKVHLRLLYGTGLPFGPPDSERYQQTLRMPDYRRVDIGFSWQFIHEGTTFGAKNPFKHFREMTLSFEIFNLFQTYNTVSYIWIKDVNGRQYAVPNYLTPRLLNLKLSARF